MWFTFVCLLNALAMFRVTVDNYVMNYSRTNVIYKWLFIFVSLMALAGRSSIAKGPCEFYLRKQLQRHHCWSSNLLIISMFYIKLLNFSSIDRARFVNSFRVLTLVSAPSSHPWPRFRNCKKCGVEPFVTLESWRPSHFAAGSLCLHL